MSRWSLSAKRRRTIAAALLLLVLGGALVDRLVPSSTADEDDEESTVKAPSRVTVKNGVTVLTLDAAAQRDGGIETARPSPPPSQDDAVGYGTVLDAGALTELSNRYLDAKAQVQTADAKLTVSRAALERAKTLYNDRQNISAAQLQSAEGSFAVDRAALAAAQSHLTTIAATAQQAWGPVIGAALVDDAALVRRLIERQDYLVKVALPPDVTVAEPPDTASATLSNGTTAQLRFLSPATTTDPRLQGASYFYVGPAGSGLLPGLNVTVSLPTGRTPQGVVVPGSAVVWLEGKPWVYLRTGPQTFVRRQVVGAQGAPEGGYIVANIPSDAQVAVRGAQMLLSEEFRAQTHSEEDER